MGMSSWAELGRNGMVRYLQIHGISWNIPIELDEMGYRKMLVPNVWFLWWAFFFPMEKGAYFPMEAWWFKHRKWHDMGLSKLVVPPKSMVMFFSTQVFRVNLQLLGIPQKIQARAARVTFAHMSFSGANLLVKHHDNWQKTWQKTGPQHNCAIERLLF